MVILVPLTVKFPAVTVRPIERLDTGKLGLTFEPIPATPFNLDAVASERTSKVYLPATASVETEDVQDVEVFEKVALFFKRSPWVPKFATVSLRVVNADLISLRAEVFEAFFDWSACICLCGARFTSINWSTSDFQSNPDANPESAIPIVTKSVSWLKTLALFSNYFWQG